MNGRTIAQGIALAALLSCSSPAAAQSATASTQGTATLSGRVLAGDSRQPIAGATVSVLSYEVMPLPKTLSTGADGRFEFTGLPAGRYQLSGSAPRFLRMQYGQQFPARDGTPIDLQAGSRFDRADVLLFRPSAIEGTVVDEFGDPAPNVFVQLSIVQFVGGSHRLAPAPGRPLPTDDRGHYRVSSLTPGDYYINASAGAFSDPTAPGGFATTYFPGTTEVARARPIRVALGQEVRDASFALTPAPSARVSGTILGADGQPTAATVMLVTSDLGTLSAANIARAGADAQGQFQFRNVPPGSYVVQAFGFVAGGGNLGRSPFGAQPIAVNGANVDNLTIKVAGASATGRIVLDAEPSGTARLAPREVRITPVPADFDTVPVGGGPPESVTNEDWTFRVGNMNGVRLIRADVRSLEWTLARVTLNGRDITDEPVDFRKGDIANLELTLTRTAPIVSGAVVGDDQRPALNYIVIAFASEGARWRFPSRFVQVGRPNQQGRYTITGLPPDDYLIVAIPTVQGFDWQDPLLLEKLRPLATAVTLAQGERKILDLRLVPRPD